MGKQVKIYQTESYTTYVVREPITIDLDDYPELEGMTDEEAVAYLDENKWDFSINDSSEDSLASEFEFNRDIIKDKFMNEELTIHLLKED